MARSPSMSVRWPGCAADGACVCEFIRDRSVPMQPNAVGVYAAKFSLRCRRALSRSVNRKPAISAAPGHTAEHSRTLQEFVISTAAGDFSVFELEDDVA